MDALYLIVPVVSLHQFSTELDSCLALSRKQPQAPKIVSKSRNTMDLLCLIVYAYQHQFPQELGTCHLLFG